VAALLTAPLLYYALSDYQGVITPATHNPADLLTFAFPTGTAGAGGSLAAHFDPAVANVSAEDGQYLGLPLLAIVVLFAVRRWRRAGSRFLLLALGLAALATLGSELRIRGRDLFPLPWRLVRDAPFFDNVIPGRFALYVALVAALIAAVWAASPEPSRALRMVLTGGAALALVPALWHGYWHEHPSRPPFFAARLDRSCLKPGDSVLVLPPPFRNSALLWQAESGFRFGLADGALNDAVPGSLPHRATMLQIVDDNVPAGGARAVLAAALAQGVDAILVAPAGGGQWRSVLDPVLRGRRVGGMTLYRLDGLSCRQT
jgi:hypothetical protein